MPSLTVVKNVIERMKNLSNFLVNLILYFSSNCTIYVLNSQFKKPSGFSCHK